MLEKIEWRDAAKIVLALIASGFAWTAENQAGVISLVAMLLVWGFSYFAKNAGWRVGKVELTGFLFVVSVGLSILFQPIVFPAFPAWGGDVVGFISAILTWAGAVVALGGQVFVWATANYNLLLAKVLEKFEPAPAL